MHDSLNLRPLDFGEVLDGAFSVYRRHFRPLFMTALFPVVLLSIAMFSVGMIETLGLPPAATIFGFTVLYAGAAILSLVIWGALVAQVGTAVLSDRALQVNEGLGHGARRAPALLGSAVLALLAGAAGGTAGVMMVGAAGYVHTAFGVLLGLAFFVAAIAYFVSLFGMIPAVVLEERGPLEGLTRSWTLARGSLLRIFGILAVTWIITTVPMMLAGVFIGIGSVVGVYLESLVVMVVSGLLMMAAYAVLMALTMPFSAAVLTLVFFDRVARTDPPAAPAVAAPA